MEHRASVLLVLLSALLSAETDVPRFEDYPAPTDWHGPAAPVRLVIRSERMFQARLTEGAKKPPVFAGHYSFPGWGCGSVCIAGAIIDLQTGDVYAPPLAQKGWEGAAHWISCTAAFRNAIRMCTICSGKEPGSGNSCTSPDKTPEAGRRVRIN